MSVLRTHVNEGHLENIRRSKSSSVDYWCSLSSSKENLPSTNAHSTDRSGLQHVLHLWGRLFCTSLRNYAGNTNLRDGSRCSNLNVHLNGNDTAKRLGWIKAGSESWLVLDSFLSNIWIRHCRDQFSYLCRSQYGTLAGHRDASYCPVGSTLHQIFAHLCNPGSTLIRLVGESHWTLMKALLTPLLSRDVM